MANFCDTFLSLPAQKKKKNTNTTFIRLSGLLFIPRSSHLPLFSHAGNILFAVVACVQYSFWPELIRSFQSRIYTYVNFPPANLILNNLLVTLRKVGTKKSVCCISFYSCPGIFPCYNRQI